MAHQCDIMKKSILIGSILAVVLLVLAMFPTVASAQATNMTINEKILSIQNIFNKRDEYNAGGIIELILTLIGGFIGLISVFSIFILLYLIGDVSV